MRCWTLSVFLTVCFFVSALTLLFKQIIKQLAIVIPVTNCIVFLSIKINPLFLIMVLTYHHF